MANGGGEHSRTPPLTGETHERPHRVVARPRFLKLEDVAATLSVSDAQAYALVRSGDLPAVKIGGRGQWRIEARVLEEWIAAQYELTRRFVADHPLQTSRRP